MSPLNLFKKRETASERRGPDFCIEIYEEKKPNNGEDSYYYAVGNGTYLAGVFDGCGGSGARRYERAQGKTGAYLASRAAAGALRDWYLSDEVSRESAEAVALLKRRIQSNLNLCKGESGGVSRIKGSISKDLPTTSAIILARDTGTAYRVSCIWAGDSRCYLLDANGLHQLSLDDLSGLDAMQNISADGVLRNVMNATTDFELGLKELEVEGPCLLFAASDGCFGYVKSPMQFEYMLLETLCQSSTPAEWETSLRAAIARITGDDSTLCGISLGFGDFAHLARAMEQRKNEVYERYIVPITQDQADVAELWTDYRVSYERYLIPEESTEL